MALFVTTKPSRASLEVPHPNHAINQGRLTMKKISVLLGLMLALPAFAAAEDWNNVSIIDSQCSAKAKADPDSHTRACAMTCSKSGFGILDNSGNYLKFHGKGN